MQFYEIRALAHKGPSPHAPDHSDRTPQKNKANSAHRHKATDRHWEKSKSVPIPAQAFELLAEYLKKSVPQPDQPDRAPTGSGSFAKPDQASARHQAASPRPDGPPFFRQVVVKQAEIHPEPASPKQRTAPTASVKAQCARAQQVKAKRPAPNLRPKQKATKQAEKSVGKAVTKRKNPFFLSSSG